jgi:pimeloyl-ACP methyl ester carboxylesterase
MIDVVWIHGFPLSPRVFDRQHAIRGAAHHFFALPPEPSVHALAGAALAQVEGPAVFAGLSMGGYVCFEIARIAPGRVRGLILLDTRETADTAEQKKGRYDSIAKVRAEGTGPIVESMLPKMVRSAAYAAEVRQIMESVSPDVVTSALEAMAERPDSSPLLPSLQVPVLIIVGEDDAITPPADAERMASLLPNATLVRIADAAHLANVEKAAEVNAAIEAWLQTIDSAP